MFPVHPYCQITRKNPQIYLNIQANKHTASHMSLFIEISWKTCDHLLNNYWLFKHSENTLHYYLCLVTNRDHTSTLQRTLVCPQHKTILAHTDKAAKSVLAGLPWVTHINIPLTLIYICNTTQTCVRHQQHIWLISLHNSPDFCSSRPHSPAPPQLFKTNTHTRRHTNQTTQGQGAKMCLLIPH